MNIITKPITIAEEHKRRLVLNIIDETFTSGNHQKCVKMIDDYGGIL